MKKQQDKQTNEEKTEIKGMVKFDHVLCTLAKYTKMLHSFVLAGAAIMVCGKYGAEAAGMAVFAAIDAGVTIGICRAIDEYDRVLLHGTPEEKAEYGMTDDKDEFQK